MKIFLNVSELKTIRDDLYRCNGRLKEEMNQEKLKSKTLEICEEKYAEREKLIDYFNRMIRDNEES